jgi:phage-related protein
MRHTFAVPAISAVLLAALLAGCGGGNSSSSSTTAASSSTTSVGGSALCADISRVQSAANAFKQLDPSTTSAAQIGQAISNLGTSVQALASDAFEAAGEAGSNLKSAASSFQSQLKSAQDQPVPQQLVTLGAAIAELENSVTQTTTQLDCNQ